jgi:hypothetical protein
MEKNQPPLPDFGDMVDETVPLIFFVAVAGPPVLFIVAPWLLVALLLAGPFALALVIVAALVAARAVIGCIVAILAAPYLLLRRHRAAEASVIAAPIQFEVAT